LLLSDILWIQSDGNYCSIHTGDKKYVLKKSLVKILELLSADYFIRVHMKFIVAIDKIIKLDLSVNKVFIGENELAVGPRFRADLIKILNPL